MGRIGLGKSFGTVQHQGTYQPPISSRNRYEDDRAEQKNPTDSLSDSRRLGALFKSMLRSHLYGRFLQSAVCLSWKVRISHALANFGSAAPQQ